MATIDRFKVIAVIANASAEINRAYVSANIATRECSVGKKANAIVLSQEDQRVVSHVTDLTARTIESRLDTEFYLNI